MIDKYDKKLEEKWMEYWYSNNIYEFVDDGKHELYIIDTPPPFTSGKMHMGHVLSYSLFDFAARFKRMKGYAVLYPQGWDSQGFPTEVKVEAKYGRGLSREEFVKKCVEWTEEFISMMRKQMQRMGFSADWKREYVTMKPEYHKKVQLSLMKMYEQGLVYKAAHPVFWCPNCVSAIAKAETEEVPRNTKLNYLKFKCDDGKDLLIATTRPEYLHACVAVFVHPDDERYKGIIGKEIETPLGKKVKIYSDVDVERDFGTGVVMVCTFGDKQDAVWVYRHNLPVIDAIDEHGRLKNAGEFDGLKLEEARAKIMEKLEAEGKVEKIEPLSQVVKIHDRCKKPIELKVSDQWFCKIDGFQRDIITAAKKMKWIPEFTLQYLIDWTNFIEWDWVISRQRYFGTPIPFYVCKKCGKTKAVDESELPFRPENARKDIKCECGETMVPETSTCDCWVDSSITPLIIAGWPEKGWERYFPATLRPQGIEIIRTWAFYTVYRSLMLTGKPPFKEVLLNGNVLGPDGKKMSKSLGNIVDPLELIEQYSADAVRIWSASSGAATHDRPFNYQEMKFAQAFINKVWNASRFVQASCADYVEGEYDCAPTDKWILGRLEETQKKAEEAYENYDYFTAMSSVENFFWHDFCDNYLEFVKHRIYGQGGGSKRAAQKTLLTVLNHSLKIMAPIIAFTTEEIYHEMFAKSEKKDSIHLSEWPGAVIDKIDGDVMERGALLVKVIGEIRKHKSTRKLSMKEEMPAMRIALPKDAMVHGETIKEEVEKVGNIKNVDFVAGEAVSILE